MRSLFLGLLLIASAGAAKELPAGFVSVQYWDEEELGVVVRGTLARELFDRLTGVEVKTEGALRVKRGPQISCERLENNVREDRCAFQVLPEGEVAAVPVPLSESRKAYDEDKLGMGNLDRDDRAAAILNVKGTLAETTLGFFGQAFPKSGLMKMEQGDSACSMYRGRSGRGGIYRPRIRKCTFRFSADGKVVR